jgi:hypothetical protein
MLYGTEGGFTKRIFRCSGDGTRGQPTGFRSRPDLDKADPLSLGEDNTLVLPIKLKERFAATTTLLTIASMRSLWGCGREQA